MYKPPTPFLIIKSLKKGKGDGYQQLDLNQSMYNPSIPSLLPFSFISYNSKQEVNPLTLKREGDIYFTQCHVIVYIALKNKTIGFIKQNSNKRERDDFMKLKWTLSLNSLRMFRACVYRKKLKQCKISADFHYLLHQIKVF